jgi:copper homeostasis protein
MMLEVCAGSYADGMAAFKGGAKRIELNSALPLGGLTPSITELIRLKKETSLSIICMVRPRPAGFAYNEMEKDIMLEEAKRLLDAGADGIAFGFLEEDGAIHHAFTKEMTDLIHSYGKEAVFHRAFDVTPNPYQAIEMLIALHVDRVLTSGQRAKAIQGAKRIRKLQKTYGNDIEILAGSGITEANVQTLVTNTDVKQVHSSCKGYVQDPTTCRNDVSYACLDGCLNDSYTIVSEDAVRRLNQIMHSMEAL